MSHVRQRPARSDCHLGRDFNQTEAKQKMTEWLANDRRFDAFDPQRLIERVQLSKNNGAVLDLDDPQLQRGGQPRPLDRWR
jgi:hypothetical protein